MQKRHVTAKLAAKMAAPVTLHDSL